MMLTRKNDASMDFDVVKVKEYSKDNPVFYVQYANVRAKSIIAKAQEIQQNAFNIFKNEPTNFNLLRSKEELYIIKLLSFFPKMVETAAAHFEPHRIAFYLQNLAAEFHAIWNVGKENSDFRFLVSENDELTAARLHLAKAVSIIIKNGFNIIGVEPMEKM